MPRGQLVYRQLFGLHYSCCPNSIELDSYYHFRFIYHFCLLKNQSIIQPKPMSLNTLWETSKAPYYPIVAKEGQFTVGFALLFIGRLK